MRGLRSINLDVAAEVYARRGGMLDVPTLLFALVLTDLVLAAALWLGIGRTDRRGVPEWTISLLLQAAVFVIGAITRAKGVAPVPVAVPHALAAAAYALQASALLRFYGRRMPPSTYGVAALLMAAVATMLPEQKLQVVASVVYAVAMLGIGRIARSLHQSPRRMGVRLVVIGLYLGGTVMIVRGLGAANPGVLVRFDGAGPIAALAALLAHAVTIGCSLGFLLMHRERHEEGIERLAMTDALTGVYNRRTLFDLGEKELSRARRTGTPVAVVILDIDHFKKINDTHGHQAGDAVLAHFVEVVRGCLRRSDLLARYGGEEFCVVLPGEDRDGAITVAERIRAAIEAARIDVGPRELRITSSAGVATLGRAPDLATLIGRADQALYAAKQNGRNRVEAYA